ncbi:AAA family ATPase [Brevibacterium salitolerans]|uniref:AAA family ATPase n=1 Tax=Brevibacterium salitolerans TaxID=1403566 RepID=UPI0031D2FB0E
MHNGAWLDAQEFPPLQWAVHGLVPEGFGLLTGPPKLGKSWFILGILLSISGGNRALGQIHVQQREVLYLALEDGDRRMQARVHRLTGGTPTPATFYFTTRAEASEVPAMVRAWLGTHPQGVVSLDTLGRVMPPALPGESAYQRDYRVGAQLKAITDDFPGSTLIVVHHTRKQGSSDWMDSTSGTNGLNGAADWTLSLERSRNDGEAVIRVTGRDVPEGEYAATMTDGTWALMGTSLRDAADAVRTAQAQEGLGDRSADIVGYISQNPQGVRAAELAQAFGMESNQARTYLSRLTKAERIANPGRGLYTPVASVASVASEGVAHPRNPADATLATDATPEYGEGTA